jgi:hypothetical protein
LDQVRALQPRRRQARIPHQTKETIRTIVEVLHRLTAMALRKEEEKEKDGAHKQLLLRMLGQKRGGMEQVLVTGGSRRIKNPLSGLMQNGEIGSARSSIAAEAVPEAIFALSCVPVVALVYVCELVVPF